MPEYVAKGQKVVGNYVVCPVCNGNKVIAQKEKIPSPIGPGYQERIIYVICPACNGRGYIERPIPPRHEVPITSLGQPKEWGTYKPLSIKLERGK